MRQVFCEQEAYAGRETPATGFDAVDLQEAKALIEALRK